MNRILYFLGTLFMLFCNNSANAQNPCIPVGEDACENAPILSPCQLDGWMSDTNPPGIQYTPGNTVPQVGWCGGNFSIENNQWLGFIADEDKLIIQVDISDCEANTGVQVACYEQGVGGACVGDQLSCIGYQSGENTSFNFNIFGLTPGDTYLIMIDGYAGDGCPFTFNIVEGTVNPVVAQANPLPVCPGIPNAAALNGFGSATGPGVEYLWETQDGNIISGETTLFPIIDQPGEYTLTVIDNASCCLNTTQVIVPENTDFPEAVANVDGAISCDNPFVTLNAVGSDGSPNNSDYYYQWYGPDGNDIALAYELEGISEPGTYTLQVLNAATGCLSETTVEVPVDTISPSVDPMIDPNSNGFIDCINNQLTIEGNGSNGVDYSWDGPDGFNSIAESPTIEVGGEYFVTVTGSNGCTAAASIEVPVDTLPPDVSVIDGAIDCNNPTAILEATSTDAGVSFEWSATGFSDSGEQATVSGADDYLVIATGANGCTSTAVASVSEDLTPPTATASVSDILDCNTTQVQLDGNSENTNVSYAWASSDGSTFLEEDPMVSSAVTYTLTVTNLENGCTETATVDVTEDISPPSITTTVDDVLDCVTNQVEIIGSTSDNSPTFSWAGVGGFSNDTANPSVENAGDYTLTVTGENGCTSTSTVTVTEDLTLPQADAGQDGMLTCQDTETGIDGSLSSSGPEYTYEWQNSGGSSISNAISTQVGSAGTYTLIVTNTTNGCTNSDDVEIATDENLPVADAGSPQTITCSQDQVTLDGTASSSGSTISYTWYDSNNNPLGTDLNLQTDAAGTYTLAVSDSSNGCESLAQVEVQDNTTPPTAVAGQPQTITCAIPQITIDGSASSGTGTIQYLWTDENGATVSTNPSFENSTAGIYNLLITNDDNGCTATGQVTIGEDTVLPQADAGSPATITCVETQVPLDASASQGENLVYEWTNSNGDIVSTEASSLTGDSDTYNLLVTNTVNGCTDSVQVFIDIDADFPTVDVGNPTTLTCATLDAVLDGSNSSGGDNLTFEWQDEDGMTLASDAITNVSASGVYTLFVTNTDNDCTAQSTLEIPQDTEAPTSDAGANQIITCDITDVTLDGAASSTGTNFSYEWTNEGGVNLGTETTVSVSTPGTYNLLVTDNTNGCTATSNTLVEPDENIPMAIANLDGILTCQNTSVSLDNTGSSTGGTIEYQWADADGNMISFDNQIDVSEPGIYSVLVTDTSNGCTNEASLQVEQDITPPDAEAGDGAILTCAVTSVALDGSASTAPANLEYEWSNPSGAPIGTTAMIDVGEAGDYTLVVTNTENGCTADDQVTVTPDENLPVPDAGLPQTLTCAITSVQLDGSNSSGIGNLEYEWQAPDGSSIASTATSDITVPGTYTLLITDDSNGCTATGSVVIDQDIDDPNPQIANPDMLTCTVESVLLDGTNSEGVSLLYEWQNANGVVVGNTASVMVSESGIYELLVTDESNGCTATTQAEVIPDENLPTALAQVNDILTCITEAVILDNAGSSTGTNVAYEWQSPAGQTIGSQNNQTVTTPGIYTLLVTDNNNGCISETTVEVTEDIQEPQAIIDQNNPIISCDIESIQLDGSASLPNGMLSYEWLNSGGVQVSTVPQPDVEDVDTYMLVVTNVTNGCTNASSIEVLQDVDVPVVDIPNPETITCYAPTIDLLSTGSSTGDFTYVWTDAAGNVISNETSISVDAGGIYELTLINNENGCDNANSVQVVVDQELPLATTAVNDILDCITPNVDLSSTGSSVGTEFEYEWSGPGLLSAVSDENPMVNEAGTYALLITNTENGCSASDTVDVDENTAQPTAGLIGAADPSCFGDSDGTIQVDQIVGGTAPYLYSFNGGTYSSAVDFVNLPSGNYTLEVEDATGCTWDTLLNLVDPVAIDVALGPDLVVPLGESVDLNAIVNVETDTIIWVGADSLSCTDCLVQSLTPTQSGTYQITAYDEKGCVDTDEIFLRIEIIRPVFVPNAFSPADENGVNDGFTVFTKPKLVKEIKTLMVADRWGEIVFVKNNFQPNDPALGWDGLFNGKPMDPQVLVWYTEVEFIDGVVLDYKGDVTIIK